MRGSHAVGVENFQIFQLFADAGIKDRLARHRADRKRRAAARVAVELGKHNAVDVELFVEGLCNVDRVLTGHRVDNEDRLVDGKLIVNAL